MKESYLWSQLKSGLSDGMTHLSRIENTAGTGISDVSACRNGSEVWIELKVAHQGQIQIRNSQRIWISGRISAGGKIKVVIRIDESIFIFHGRDILSAPSTTYPTRKASYIKVANLPEPLYRCKKPFNWEKIGQAIFNA